MNTPSVVIGAISDTHYSADDRDTRRRENTLKALRYFRDNGADILLFNADITDFGEVGAYRKLIADIRSVYPDETSRPVCLFASDNHEYYDAWNVNGHIPICDFPVLHRRFVEEMAPLRGDTTDKNSVATVNGYRFIMVSSDGMNGGWSTMTDQTVEWIAASLREAAADTPGRPIFLCIHQPPRGSVCGSNTPYPPALLAELQKYPQLVLITSHTHCALQDELSVVQADYTVLNTASQYYVYDTWLKNLPLHSPDGVAFDFGQCLLLRVNGNAIEAERFDSFHNETIGENWRFTAPPAADSPYTAARAKRSVAPRFPTQTLTVTRVSDTEAAFTFTAATHPQFVHSYEVEIGNGEETRTDRYSSLFHLGLSRMPQTLTFTVSGLRPDRAYTLSLYAVDNYGNRSTPLTADLL